jgi:hypothetical protein
MSLGGENIGRMINPVPLPEVRLSYPRRQQYQRLSRAGGAMLASIATGVSSLMAASIGALLFAGLLFLAAITLAFYARHWLALAGRSRIGARSEEEVRSVLAPLRSEGWRLRHSLSWLGRGDIDSVAIAPGGIAVVIETKTRTYRYAHLRRLQEQAAWLACCRPRWCAPGVVAILCLAGTYGVQRVEDDVLVVSIDRLTPMVRGTANLVHLPLIGSVRCWERKRASRGGKGACARWARPALVAGLSVHWPSS